VRLKHRLLRLLGVVSPSGAYPLPPRWALSKLGRARYHPEQQLVVASGDRSIAAGGSIGYASTGAWAADVAAGPVPRGALTRFTSGDEAQHTHGATSRGLCGPGGSAACFDRTPYVPEADR